MIPWTASAGQSRTGSFANFGFTAGAVKIGFLILFLSACALDSPPSPQGTTNAQQVDGPSVPAPGSAAPAQVQGGVPATPSLQPAGGPMDPAVRLEVGKGSPASVPQSPEGEERSEALAYAAQILNEKDPLKQRIMLEQGESELAKFPEAQEKLQDLSAQIEKSRQAEEQREAENENAMMQQQQADTAGIAAAGARGD